MDGTPTDFYRLLPSPTAVCYRPLPPSKYSLAFSSAGSLPASRSFTVGTTSTSGLTPAPAKSVPSGERCRVTENCTLQLFGSANVATSPGLPPDGSPITAPRPAARNTATRSSAAPLVALEISTAMGPPYDGWSRRGATVPLSGPYQVRAESARFNARNTARYWGVLQRTAASGRSLKRASIW